MHRYAEILNETKEVEVLKELETLDGLLEKIEKLKEAGNALFKKEKLDEAIFEFSNGLDMIKNNINTETQLSDSRVTALMLQLYNNRALAYLKLDCNNDVIKDCEKVLELDPGNVKALYRLAKAEGNTGNLESAAKHMKMVTEIEPSNLAAKKEFDNLVKLAIEAKRKSQESEEKKVHTEKHVGFKEEVKEEIIIPPTEKKPQKPKPTKFSEETVSLAKKQAFDQLGSFEAPKNSTSFEVTLNSIKNDPSQVYHYIHNLTPENIGELFRNTQMSPEIFTVIIKSLHSLTDIEYNWVANLLNELLNTSRFSTTIKFLSRSEKNTIRELISKLIVSEDLKSNLSRAYNL